MIIEYAIPTLNEFLATVPQLWFRSILLLLFVALVVGLFFSILHNGFAGCFHKLFQGVGRGFEHLFRFSPARTWAIARLVMKESVRRRIVVLCIVFMLILLFAGWFLDPNSEDPAKLYHSFVLDTTSYLVMLLALFLSAFSLPTDFKAKTIYTIVTKPVRPSEMVFGRVLGIGLIGTAVLALMLGLSYFFVKFGLDHTHLLTQREDLTELSVASEEAAARPDRVVYTGETRQSNGHKHHVEVLANNKVRVAPVNGHTHRIDIEQVGNTNRYTVHSEQGTLQSRVPIYGKLNFRNQETLDTKEGINVGNEWMYRSFIGGGSRGVTNEEAAIFRFSGIDEKIFPRNSSDFKDGLPVEMTLGVFRTYKADIEKRVSASIALRNPKTGLRVEVMTFSTEEFITKSLLIPWKFDGTPQITQRRMRDEETGEIILTPSNELAEHEREKLEKRSTAPNDPDDDEADFDTEFDFFKDFVADGEVEIWLQCIDRQQYIGVAQADLYLRARDTSVPLNFLKGFFGIWMQMLIITAYGVLFSTFLSGPVAMISTVGVMIAGFAKTFLMEIAANTKLGGGPFESLFRLVTQDNMMTDLPSGFATTFVKQADVVYSWFMTLIGQVIPPLSDYYIYYKALVSGFSISEEWIVIHVLLTAAYVLPLFLVAYLILGAREVAK